MSEPFSVEDFDELSALVATALAIGGRWRLVGGRRARSTGPAGPPLDHTIDCVFSYVLFLASRRQDSYPPFGELHALSTASPADLIEGLQAVCRMLSAVIRASAPDTRAVILRWPTVVTGDPEDFAARGAHEMMLHAHDICSGLGVVLRPAP